jgi:hypothetical protein
VPSSRPLLAPAAELRASDATKAFREVKAFQQACTQPQPPPPPSIPNRTNHSICIGMGGMPLTVLPSPTG